MLECRICKANTPHKLNVVTQFVTRYRTLTVRIYECFKCNTLKTTNYEKEHKNPEIWD